MRVVISLCSALAITGCAGMKPIKLGPAPGITPRAMVVQGVGGLHRAQYEDSTLGRLQLEALVESRCGGPAQVVSDGEIQIVSGGGFLLGKVIVPLNSRPGARGANLSREVSFRCGPLEL